jgi:hypothetical protein
MAQCRYSKDESVNAVYANNKLQSYGTHKHTNTLCRQSVGFFKCETRSYDKIGRAVPVTGRRGPLGCETSRLPHSLDNQFTGGGEVVRLTSRPPFTPRKIPGTHFC